MKKTLILLLTVILTQVIYSQDSAKILYLKGNIQDKGKAVVQAANQNDYSLAIESIDFCLSTKNILGQDADMEELLISSLKVLQEEKAASYEKDTTADKLTLLFKNYENQDIKTEIINTMAFYPSTAGISLINAFVSEEMQKRNPITPVLIAAIETLKTCGNSNSFNVLFIADLLDVWPEYTAVLGDAYGTLADISEKEILHILSTVPTDMKLKMLEKINYNPKISRKIRGEVAENALSMSINNTETKKEKDGSSISLEYTAIKTISGTKWTRASDLATKYFPTAREEYEAGYLTEEQFADIIKCITSVASAETSYVLSSYLDFLNKSTEKNQAVSKVVVLSVINSLGELGDKTAFDYLLYVTYLDYPEEVTTAARISLTKLKW